MVRFRVGGVTRPELEEALFGRADVTFEKEILDPEKKKFGEGLNPEFTIQANDLVFDMLKEAGMNIKMCRGK